MITLHFIIGILAFILSIITNRLFTKEEIHADEFLILLVVYTLFGWVSLAYAVWMFSIGLARVFGVDLPEELANFSVLKGKDDGKR